MTDTERPDPGHGTSTRAVHGGEERRKFGKSVTTPITQTSTYVFDDLDEYEKFKAGEVSHYEYGRYNNPTVRAAELKVAAVEGAEDALLFSSGMSAITTVLLAMLRSGQHVVILQDCYRRTVQFCQLIAKYGIECTVVKEDTVEAVEAALQPNTRLIFIESPTNPHLHLVDLERLVAMARPRQLKVLIDSTFATPYNLRPLSLGVDLVFHSATKYLGGHNDLVVGAMAGSAEMVRAVKEFRDIVGTMADPQSSYLLIRGIKTLAVRMERQNASALRLAEHLEGHDKIRKVYYPGLPSHPQHDLAVRQMSGYGGVVSFDLDGDLARTRAFLDALKIPYLAPSLGGVESLVSHPATLSYYDLGRDGRLAIGILDELVRYAVGVEDADDLIADVDQALATI